MGFFSGIKKALKKITKAFVKPFKAVSNSLRAVVSPKLGAAAAVSPTVAVKAADRIRQRQALASGAGLLASATDANSLTEEYLGLPGNYPDAPVTLGSVHRQHQTLGS